MLQLLPPELIQLVFQYSDPTTYMQLALTCRGLFYIASHYREALVHHLNNMPGYKYYLEELDTAELFERFMLRCDNNLYGVQFHADRKIFRAGGQRVNDARASSFTTVRGMGEQLLALVFKDDATVYVMRVADDGELMLRQRLRQTVRQPCKEKVEVLRTAFNQREGGEPGLYILQRRSSFLDEEDLKDTPLTMDQVRPFGPFRSIYLLYRGLESSSARLCAFIDRSYNDYDPVGFTVRNGSVAISWQHQTDETQSKVVLYREDLEQSIHDDGVSYNAGREFHLLHHIDADTAPPLAELCYESRAILIGQLCASIVDLRFNDGETQLLYRRRGESIYGLYQDIEDVSFLPDAPQLETFRNTYLTHIVEGAWIKLLIDIPFFGQHEIVDRTDIERARCHRAYLALGITEDHRIAYLLSSSSEEPATAQLHFVIAFRGWFL